MYSQAFNANELYRLTTQSERRACPLSKDKFIAAIESLAERFAKREYEFKFVNEHELFVNAHSSETDEEKLLHLFQNLVMRKLYNNIKRVYKIKQANRNKIIRQIRMLLKSPSDFWVIRLDIQSFYESLNRDKIITELSKGYRLSPISIYYLKALFEVPCIKNASGLPRGIGISSAMSEIAMKYFDMEIQQAQGVYFYARFVDDIVVFCETEASKNFVWRNIKHKLKEMSLQMNGEKSYNFSRSELSNRSLEYLGYSFRYKEKELQIDIAPLKVNKIKTRLVRAFVNFSKNGDLELLRDRIKYLTGNFSIEKTNSLMPLKTGIYYNYRMQNANDSLTELDRFYQEILHCRNGRLGVNITTKITDLERKSLERFSFFKGFKHRTCHSFDSRRIHQIKACWL